MRHLLTRAARVARRNAPSTIAIAALALSLGVYSGQAAILAPHELGQHTFSLALQAKAVTLNPGSAARLTIVIRRRGIRSGVAFRVLSALPRGITARFAPTRTPGKRTSLTLRTTRAARPGQYRVRLVASGGHVHRTADVNLTVLRQRAVTQSRSGQAPDFSITGNVGVPLKPGAPQPIDVLVTNPNDLPLNLTNLSVVVQGISAPEASPSLPCTQSDFAVQPYTGPIPLTVPASSSETLSGLGIPSNEWPEVSIVDLPMNQDGCQGASLSLTYSADGRLG